MRPAGLIYMADVALDQGGANDVETGGGRLEVLALKMPKRTPSAICKKATTVLALAVMQPAVGKIEFARR